MEKIPPRYGIMEENFNHSGFAGRRKTKKGRGLKQYFLFVVFQTDPCIGNPIRKEHPLTYFFIEPLKGEENMEPLPGGFYSSLHLWVAVHKETYGDIHF